MSSSADDIPTDSGRLGVIPELEAVAIKGDVPAASSLETTQLTLLRERRQLDQSRFEDLADHQPAGAFRGMVARMVGRAGELDSLHGAWRTATQSNHPVLTLVTGPVGIGKTRLLDEFVLQLERSGRVFRQVRSSVREGAADLRSAILDPVLRARFEIAADLPPAEALAKLQQELASAGPEAGESDLALFLSHLLGLESAEVSVRRDTMELLEGRAQAALARFMNVEARQQPLLWVLDDLEHGSGPLLTAFYSWCCSLQQAPILIAGLALPSIFNCQLPWTREGYQPGPREPLLKHLPIGPLTEAETRRILESYLGPRELSDELVTLAANRTRGNPLAIEQLLDLLVEHEVLSRTAQGWRIDATRLAAGEIPVSLEGLVEARLQQLVPEELKILRQAAVQGTTFGLGGVMACTRATKPAGSSDTYWFDERLEEQVRQTLLGLQTRDIIKFLRQGPRADELIFEFRHGFDREWVYRSCPDGERALYHRMYAQWLEQSTDEASRPQHDVTARHLEAGGALRRAALSYLKSARLAAAAYHNEEAIVFLRRVVTFLAEDDAAIRVEALEQLGRITYNIGDYTVAVEAATRMLRDCYLLASRERIARAYEALGRALTDLGNYAEAERCLTRYLSISEELHDQAGSALALDNLGRLYLKQGGAGSMDQAQRNFEHSLRLRRDLGDELGTAQSYHNLGWVYTDRGFTREGRLCFREAIRLRARAGDKDGLCRSLNNLAETYREAGELGRARRYYDEAFKVAEEIGAQAIQGVILGNLAECDLEDGKLADAQQRVDQALTLSSALADQPMRVTQLVIRSKIQLQQGDPSGARASAEEALHLLQQLQGSDDLGLALRQLGEILASSGQGGASEAEIERARECFRRSIRVLSEAGHDLELARSMESYASFLSAQGQPEKAQRYRQRAQEILVRMKQPDGG